MERGELALRLGGGAVAARPGPPRVVESRDPSRFMESFAEAVAAGGEVFLADPSWRASERAVLARHTIGGADPRRGWLMVPTGGASGGPRFARHDGHTIAAAVGGFCGHFGLGRVNSVCVLPLHHVSGFMAWMRSALTGGAFVPLDWKDVEGGRYPGGLPPDCCISLVPTQLQRLLGAPPAVDWLRRFRIVFVGGAPSWDGLLDEAAALGLALSPGYGSTETAAMVAALRPEEFLGGRRGCGSALPHARIELSAEGVVRVSGESVFRGYHPDHSDERTWTSGDQGALDPGGGLFILGRGDDTIVTGGKKVSPAEVEAALRASGEFEDVAVVGLPDAEWGQVIVACHPAGSRAPRPERLAPALSALAAYKHPKRYAAVSPWPRNAQGKVNRAELRGLAGGR
jgi:O-succinylbenzoic acid--CoA ligase